MILSAVAVITEMCLAIEVQRSVVMVWDSGIQQFPLPS